MSWRLRLVLASSATLLVFLLGEFWLFRAHDWYNHLWVNSLWTLVSLCAAIRCWITARRARTPRLKSAWRWFAAGCMSWFLGMLWWDCRELIMHFYTPFPEISEIGFLGLSPCAILGILNYRRLRVRAGMNWVHVGELGYLFFFTLFLNVFLFYGPILQFSGKKFYLIAALAYPVLRGFSLFFAFFAFEFFNWGRRKRVMIFLLLALGTLAMTDTVFAVTLVFREYLVGQLLDVFWVVPFLFFFWAAAEEDRLSANFEPGLSLAPQIRSVGMLLPAILMVFALIGFYSVHGSRIGALPGSLLVIMTLMSLFQGVYTLGYRKSDAQLRALLEAERSYLETVLDKVPVGVIIADGKTGEIVRVNQTASEILKIPRGSLTTLEALGAFFQSRYPDGTPCSWEDWPLTRSARFGESIAGEELEMTLPDGTLSMIQISSSPVFQKGELVGVVAACLDVTEARRSREALKKSEARNAAIVQSAVDCVVTMDADGLIREFNPAAERTFGYRPSEVIGKELATVLVPPHLREAHREGLTRYLKTGASRIIGFPIELEAMKADGTLFPVEVLISRVAVGGPALFTGFIRDITERKKAREDAEKLVDLRDKFFLMASHELMTPMTPIKMNLQLIRRRLERVELKKSEEQALLESVERAEKQVNQMIALIGQLLEFSSVRVEGVPLKCERVELASLVREVADRYSPIAAKARSDLVLTLAEGAIGFWDRKRIEQIVENLLSNAVKFGAGSPVEIRVSCASGAAKLSVRDHGPGIPEADQERIFERFERPASVLQFGGLGLGLYMIREIARAHGGAIRLKSYPGDGAQFIVELPLSPVLEQKGAA